MSSQDSDVAWRTLEDALQTSLPMARLQAYRVPACRGLQLALINADFPTGPLPAGVTEAVIAQPAYWAFCWGSGQALARHLFTHPDIVRGARVLDLGSGSGVAGVAAALAGAAEVVACDTDPNARAASALNARLNEVEVKLSGDLAQCGQFDAVLMADVLYDAANLPLLQAACAHGDQIWVADSRVQSLPDAAYRLEAEIDALTLPNLGEFDEFGQTRIWCRRSN